MEHKKGMSSKTKIIITAIVAIALLAGIMFVASQLSGDDRDGNFHEQFRNQHD